MAWLDELLKQTEETEAPGRYYWWSGLAAIAAIVRKNVWLSRDDRYNLYTNIYVALISTKSGARKGVPIKLCKDLLEEVNTTRIISGCNSIQGMINELSQQKTLDNGTVISEAHGIMLSDELDAFLTDDPKSLTYFTSLFGTHEHEKKWEKTLKSGKETLKSPCLTMLIASNEIMFESVVKRKDVEGGFIARTFIVKESKLGKLNALVRPSKNKLNIPKLAIRLSEISKLRGPFKLTEESVDKYEGWYLNSGYQEMDDRTGTFNRLGDQVLKVAMLISMSKKDSLILEWEDIQTAIDKCEECAYAAARITPSNEASNGDRPNLRKLVMDAITTSKFDGIKYRATKAALLRKLQPYQVSTFQLDACIKDLINGYYIEKRELSGDGNINARTLIILTEEGAKIWVSEKQKDY